MLVHGRLTSCVDKFGVKRPKQSYLLVHQTRNGKQL